MTGTVHRRHRSTPRRLLALLVLGLWAAALATVAPSGPATASPRSKVVVTRTNPKVPGDVDHPDGAVASGLVGRGLAAAPDPAECAAATYCDVVPLDLVTPTDVGPADDFRVQIDIYWNVKPADFNDDQGLAFYLYDNTQIKSDPGYTPKQPGQNGYGPSDTTSKYTLKALNTSKGSVGDQNPCYQHRIRPGDTAAVPVEHCSTVVLNDPRLPERDGVNYNLVILNDNQFENLGYWIRAQLLVTPADTPKEVLEPPATATPTLPPPPPNVAPPPLPHTPLPVAAPSETVGSVVGTIPVTGPLYAPQVFGGIYPTVPVSPAGPSTRATPLPALDASLDPLLSQIRGRPLEDELRGPPLQVATRVTKPPRPPSGTLLAVSLATLPLMGLGGGALFMVRRRAVMARLR